MSTNFRFIDDVDAQRQLGVDRLTFEQLVRDGRLKVVSRQGAMMFFRAAEIAKLRDALHPETVEEESDTAPGDPPGATIPDAAPPAATAAKAARKTHEPAMRVHLRLTADLKWYDISDADLQAWFDQTVPEAYERYRANATFVIRRMQHIIDLLDEGQARHNELTAE